MNEEILFSATELSRIVNIDPRTASSRLRKLHVAPAATIGGRPVYSPHALLTLLTTTPGAKRLGIYLEPFVPTAENVS
jgi:hypothetical protein